MSFNTSDLIAACAVVLSVVGIAAVVKYSQNYQEEKKQKNAKQ